MNQSPRSVWVPAIAAALSLQVGVVFAQGTAPTKSLAASAGLYAYPTKNQSASVQTKDEGECYNWAKTQSGYDPLQPPAAAPAPATAQPAAPAQPDGSRVRGAARGAAAGAIIGEVAENDAGKGAAIGATAGTLAGGRQSRITQAKKQQAQVQQQQQSAAQAQAQKAELQSSFKRGMSVCLEARGYSVK